LFTTCTIRPNKLIVFTVRPNKWIVFTVGSIVVFHSMTGQINSV
jgi:hypothetical protein